MNLQKARPAFLGAAALYLLYLAYDLFQGRSEPSPDMSLPVRYAFVTFFALAAVALLVYAYKLWQNSRKQANQQTEKPPEDSDTDVKS